MTKFEEDIEAKNLEETGLNKFNSTATLPKRIDNRKKITAIDGTVIQLKSSNSHKETTMPVFKSNCLRQSQKQVIAKMIASRKKSAFDSMPNSPNTKVESLIGD